jgi:tRNA modification GTPase
MTDFGNDTIAAVITAPGTGAMGALRLSGSMAFTAAAKVFRGKNGRPLDALPGYSLTYGGIYIDGCFADQALLLKMAGPHSFTGEDVAELQCHGGPLVLARLLEALTALPEMEIRPARPGEFSQRAFLNGKMDLSQAEAVMDLVSADNQKAALLAAGQVEGALSRRIRGLKDRLLSLLSGIEAEIDFPEENLDDPDEGLDNSDEGWDDPDEGLEKQAGAGGRLLQVRQLLKALEELLAAAAMGKIYRQGLRVVFYGRPNAGKSSLLNGILQEPRAIVTPEPGTTRDTLEERILLRGIPLVLTDTAGIRESGTQAERAGVDRARRMAEKADLILYIVDIQEGITPEDEALLRELDKSRVLIIFNKTDLLETGEVPGEVTGAGARAGAAVGARAGATSGAGARAAAGAGAALTGARAGVGAALGASLGPERKDEPPKAEDSFADWQSCRLSALDPASLEILAQRIRDFFDQGKSCRQSQEILLNRRQEEALLKAKVALKASAAALEQGWPQDVAALDLRQAWSALGELTGETMQPALVEEIFSRFCLGK